MLLNEHRRAECRRQLASWGWLRRLIQRVAKNFEIDAASLLSAADEKIAALERKIRQFDDVRFQGIDGLTTQEKGNNAADVLRYAALIPEVLIEARLALNWSQKELANRAHLPFKSISRYETTLYQTVSLSTARQLCSVMHDEITQRIIERDGS